MAGRFRSLLIDAAAGFAALGAWVASVLVQARSPAAFEYLALILPAFLFPCLSGWRFARSRGPLAVTFVLVNAWQVAGFLLLGAAAGATPGSLLPSLLLGVLGSAAAAFAGARGRRAGVAGGWKEAGIPLAVALAAAAIVFAMVPSVMSRMLTRTEDSPVPDAVLKLIDGGAIDLRAQSGRVVVLNFWGVWCAPCVRELPDLERVFRSASWGDRVAFAAVDSSIGDETIAEVRDFSRKMGLTVPVAFESDRKAYDGFGIHGLPTTIVIDGRGRVRLRRVGYSATGDYEKWLRAAIDGLLRP